MDTDIDSSTVTSRLADYIAECSSIELPSEVTEKSRKLIDTVMNLEQVDNMRDLQPLMSA